MCSRLGTFTIICTENIGAPVCAARTSEWTVRRYPPRAAQKSGKARDDAGLVEAHDVDGVGQHVIASGPFSVRRN